MTQSYGDLVEAITNARFRPVRVREGYDMAEVDALLDRLVAALGRGEPVGPVVDGTQLAHVRLREGYDVGEVDAFLAEVRRTAPGESTTAPVEAAADHPPIPEQRRRLGRRLGRQ